MAERLKTKILETDKMVDLVAGPGERARERGRERKREKRENLVVSISIQTLIAVYL